MENKEIPQTDAVDTNISENDGAKLAFNLTKVIMSITNLRVDADLGMKNAVHKKFMFESMHTDTESKTSLEKQMVSLLQTNPEYVKLVEAEDIAKSNYALVNGIYGGIMTLVNLYNNSKVLS